MTLFSIGMLVGLFATAKDVPPAEKLVDMLTIGAVSAIIGAVISAIWSA